jgi:hypothetical protein
LFLSFFGKTDPVTLFIKMSLAQAYNNTQTLRVINFPTAQVDNPGAGVPNVHCTYYSSFLPDIVFVISIFIIRFLKLLLGFSFFLSSIFHVQTVAFCCCSRCCRHYYTYRYVPDTRKCIAPSNHPRCRDPTAYTVFAFI